MLSDKLGRCLNVNIWKKSKINNEFRRSHPTPYVIEISIKNQIWIFKNYGSLTSWKIINVRSASSINRLFWFYNIIHRIKLRNSDDIDKTYFRHWQTPLLHLPPALPILKQLAAQALSLTLPPIESKSQVNLLCLSARSVSISCPLFSYAIKFSL